MHMQMTCVQTASHTHHCSSTARYAPQQNNFVVFDEYFAARPPPRKSDYDSVATRPLTARGTSANRISR